MMLSDEAPEGWATVRLADGVVRDVQTGFACGTHNRAASGVPHLRPMNVNEEGEIALTDLKFVPASEVEREERWVADGDVLFNNTNSPELVGKTAYYGSPERRAFSNHMTRVRCRNDVLDPRFCAMVLHQLWREGHFRAVCNNHVSQASVSRAVLLDTPIPLPPLPEQRRILKAIDALLSRVNAARDRLAKVPAILRRLHQSVLAAACSGRLTEDWRSPPGDVQWARLTVEEVASREPRSIQSGPFGSNLKHSEFRDEGKLVIGIDNVGNGEFLPGRQHRITEAKYQELERYAARPGDVLITVMATVGRVCVVPTDIEPAIITKHVYRLTVDQQVVLPEFVAYALRGDPQVLEQIRDQTRGQTRPGINGEILKAVTLPVPPLPEQREIARRVEGLLRLSDVIERRIAAATARADKLTQSILAKAFRGELVPTEAELARQEGREYEPASVLLERIKAERAASADDGEPTRRTRRTAQKAPQPKAKRRASG